MVIENFPGKWGVIAGKWSVGAGVLTTHESFSRQINQWINLVKKYIFYNFAVEI